MADRMPGPLDTLRAAGDLWRADLSRAVARVFKWVLTIGVVGVVAATGLGAWRFSDELITERFTPPPAMRAPNYDDGQILQIGPEEVSVRPASGTGITVRSPGTYALRFPGGYGVVGPIIADGSAVVREWTPVEGEPAEGVDVAIDTTTYLVDPRQDLGIEFHEVEIPSPDAGSLPAWYVPGPRSTWVIFTHDRGEDRTQALRLLPVFSERGFPALAISYRNDPGTEVAEDARNHYGLQEWEDVQAAVRWARETGAQEVVLVGYGVGGSINLEFVDRSPFGGIVSGLVLDAPMLDLGAVIDSSEQSGRIPVLLRSLGKTIASFRFGVSWSELDYITKFDGLDVRTLLIHGTDDVEVPVELSDELSALLGENSVYLRVEGAGHDAVWNVATDDYEAAVDRFITGIIAARSADSADEGDDAPAGETDESGGDQDEG